MRQHQYSRLQIGWHRILRLSLKIEYQVCQDPHGIDFGTVCEMILIINPMGTILVCWFFLETISRFGATPPAIGCKKNTMFIFNCCKQWKVVVFQKRDSNDQGKMTPQMIYIKRHGVFLRTICWRVLIVNPMMYLVSFCRRRHIQNTRGASTYTYALGTYM